MPHEVMDAVTFLPALRRAASAMDVRRIHATAMSRVAGHVNESAEPVTAYVNHGRWLADCPNCNGGVALAHGIGCCFDCGDVFATVVWPAERTEIEEALRDRPKIRQNWYAWESVDRLKAENVERKIGAKT